jgi:4-diphosphocytidyl-2-C-methyl-D-erythritol kinase
MARARRTYPAIAVRAWAYAKLNLALEVLGRRPDGLHEILSVMQTVSLNDKLEIAPSDSFQLSCNIEELNTSDNLVIKAAKVLASHLGRPLPVSVRLMKRIPLAAGLGGGSTDAAATLSALARLAGLTVAPQDLLHLAFQLGADVPFFLRGGTCLVSGAGELVSPLRQIAPLRFLVVVPPIAVPNKTRTMYGLLRPVHFSQGSSVLALANAIDAGEKLQPELFVNTFQEIALQHMPSLKHYWDLASSITGKIPHLSGTGPCFFFILEDPAEATHHASALRRAAMRVFTLSPTSRGHILRAWRVPADASGPRYPCEGQPPPNCRTD